MDIVKYHISYKLGFGHSATRRNFVPIVVSSLSNSSSGSDSSTSRTFPRQESRCSTSSSSSSSSLTGSCFKTREREDRIESDISPVIVSTTVEERSGRPDVDHDDLSHELTVLNEVNMDFRIPVLPHSVVKHAQSTSVREVIQKLENHPDRHALQQDLRQNQAYDPCNDSGSEQHRIVRNARDGFQNAMHSMLVILERRHRLLHMRAFLAERNRGQSKLR